MEKQSATTSVSYCILLSGFVVLIAAIITQERFLLLAPNMLAPIGLITGIIGFLKVKSRKGFFMIIAHFVLLFWVFLYPCLFNSFIR